MKASVQKKLEDSLIDRSSKKSSQESKIERTIVFTEENLTQLRV